MKLIILLTLASAASVAALTCADDPSCDGCLTRPTSGGPTTCETTWGPRTCERKDNKHATVDKVYCPEDLCLVKPSCTGCVAEKSKNGGIQCRNDWDEAKCTKKKSKSKYRDTNWCGDMPLPETTAEKTACLASTGAWHGLDADFCQTCCPDCIEVVPAGNDQWPLPPPPQNSFTDNFDRTYENWHPATSFWVPYDGSYWTPKPGVNKCVCLDLVGERYGRFYLNGKIFLTEFSDCARATGRHNQIDGMGGDDAIFADGINPYIFGDEGNDHLAMAGQYGYVHGGDGQDDVCTDLGGTAIFDQPTTCETINRKLTHAAGLESGGAKA